MFPNQIKHQCYFVKQQLFFVPCFFAASCWTQTTKRLSIEAGQISNLILMSLDREWPAACWFGFLRLEQEWLVGANQSSNIDSPPPPPLTPALRKQILSFLSLQLRREARGEEGGSITTFEICSDKSVFCGCLPNQHALAVDTTGAGCRLSLPRWPQELRRSGGAGRAPIGWASLGGGL